MIHGKPEVTLLLAGLPGKDAFRHTGGTRRSRAWPLLFICAAVSLVYLLGILRFDLPLLAQVAGGTAPLWLTNHGDVAQALTGFDYFVNDAWRLPLLFTPTLGWPAGTNIVFTDSVPGFALVTKLVAGLGWGHWGLSAWIPVLVVMQGVATGAFLIAAGIRDPWIHVSGVLITLSLPVFLFRFAHLGLASHFLLILALAQYADAWSPDGTRFRTRVGFAVLLGLALLIHAYLFVMVFGIYFAAEILSWLRHGRATQVTAAATGMLLWCLAVMLLGGHLGGGGAGAGARGYGFYSLNLLSPVIPQKSALFPWNSELIDATGGQYEGYSYLGAGVLGLLAFAALRRLPALGQGLRAHWPLVLVLLGMTLFALSNTWYWGDTLVLSLPLPEVAAWLTGQFRSSGRFSWPAIYALALGTLVLVATRLPGTRGRTLVAVAALVQVIDTQPLRDELYWGALRAEPQLLPRGEIEQALAGASRVLVYPPFLCAPDARTRKLNAELLRITALANIPTNNVIRARADTDCDRERQRYLQGPAPGVVTIGILDPAEPEGPLDIASASCRRIADLRVCANGSGSESPASYPTDQRDPRGDE